MKKLHSVLLLIVLLSSTNYLYAQGPEIYYPEDFVVLQGEYLDVTIEVLDEDWSIESVYDADTGEMLEDVAVTYNMSTRKKEFTIRFSGVEVGFFVRRFYIHTIDSRGNTRVKAIEIGFFVRRRGTREILSYVLPLHLENSMKKDMKNVNHNVNRIKIKFITIWK